MVGGEEADVVFEEGGDLSYVGVGVGGSWSDAGEDVLSCGFSGGELLGSEMDGALIIIIGIVIGIVLCSYV